MAAEFRRSQQRWNDGCSWFIARDRNNGGTAACELDFGVPASSAILHSPITSGSNVVVVMLRLD